MNEIGKTESATFPGVCLNDIQTAEEILEINNILYDVDIVHGSFVGELVRWSLQKHSNTVRLLRYNSQLYYVTNIQAIFNPFRCPTCECFFVNQSILNDIQQLALGEQSMFLPRVENG